MPGLSKPWGPCPSKVWQFRLAILCSERNSRLGSRPFQAHAQTLRLLCWWIKYSRGDSSVDSRRHHTRFLLYHRKFNKILQVSAQLRFSSGGEGCHLVNRKYDTTVPSIRQAVGIDEMSWACDLKGFTRGMPTT